MSFVLVAVAFVALSLGILAIAAAVGSLLPDPSRGGAPKRDRERLARAAGVATSVSSSSRTHVICWACWDRLCVARRQAGREPVRVVDSPREPCCVCGAPTDAGIYVRRDPVSPELVWRGSSRHHLHHGRSDR